MIVRFGATFPEVRVKNGRVRDSKKHYYQDQPVYNLNAVKSFNQGLVKGIDIAYPKLTKEESPKYMEGSRSKSEGVDAEKR